MIKLINKKRNKKGFTLIELVVVIAILGILASIAVPRFTEQTANAKKVSDQASARNIVGAINVAIAAGDAEMSSTGVRVKGINAGGVKSSMPSADTASDDILINLLALKLLDEVPKPQSEGAKYVISLSTSKGLLIKSDTGTTTFYPVPK